MHTFLEEIEYVESEISLALTKETSIWFYFREKMCIG